MYVINRLALVLVLGGALFFGLRDGGREAVSGHPEALVEANVEQVDAMITPNTQTALTGSIQDGVGYAEGFGDDVTSIAE